MKNKRVTPQPSRARSHGKTVRIPRVRCVSVLFPSPSTTGKTKAGAFGWPLANSSVWRTDENVLSLFGYIIIRRVACTRRPGVVEPYYGRVTSGTREKPSAQVRKHHRRRFWTRRPHGPNSRVELPVLADQTDLKRCGVIHTYIYVRAVVDGLRRNIFIYI